MGIKATVPASAIRRAVSVARNLATQVQKAPPLASGGVVAPHPASLIPGHHVFAPDVNTRRQGFDGGGEVDPGFDAYHGTPHEFDQFQDRAIGSGEGQQAYGYGHYVAEHPDVARSYADMLAGNPVSKGTVSFAGRPLMIKGRTTQDWDAPLPHNVHPRDVASDLLQYRGDTDALKEVYHNDLQDTADRLGKPDDQINMGRLNLTSEGKAKMRKLWADHYAKLQSMIALMNEHGDKFKTDAPGRLLKVRVHASPEHFLDWDKTTAEQSPHVRDALAQHVFNGETPDWGPGGTKLRGRQLYDWTNTKVNGLLMRDRVKQMGLDTPFAGGDKERAGKFLDQIGVHGVKYYDRGSRDQGIGTSNFVVFDPKKLEIKKKYAQGGAVRRARDTGGPVTDTGPNYDTAQDGPFLRVAQRGLGGGGGGDQGIRPEAWPSAPVDTGGEGSPGDGASPLPPPEKNHVLSAANLYQARAGLKNVEKPDIPRSSLAKQSAIGKAYDMAANNHPGYKDAVFSRYQQLMPELVSAVGAKNYDQLAAASYGQMAKETRDQFDSLPLKYSFHRNGEGNYPDSKAMLADLHGNNHLFVYQGGDRHEYLHNVDPKTGLNENEKFRAVHDAYGHGLHGNGFGPEGEEKAWATHSQMYSKLARLAMTSETRGQNSFVNYTPINAKLNENVHAIEERMAEARRRGDDENFGRLAKSKASLMGQWQYAPQAAVLMPPEMHDPQYKGGMPGYLQKLIQPPSAGMSSPMTHFSNEPNLTELDPSKYGTGIKGDERARLRAYPGAVKERAYAYLGKPGQVKPEPGLGPHAYEAEGHGLYDLTADPHDFKTLARESNRRSWLGTSNPGMVDPSQFQNDIERLAKEYGYKGVANPKAAYPMAANFYPVPVRKARAGGGWNMDDELAGYDPEEASQPSLGAEPAEPVDKVERDPEKMANISRYVNEPTNSQWSGIYGNPKEIAANAAQRVAPENPAMKQLFGYTRAELNEKYGTGKGTMEPEVPGFKDKASGSRNAKNIMTGPNAQRLQDILAEAGKHRDLSLGMDNWYTMDPAFEHMQRLVGHNQAPEAYERLNHFMGMMSPGSDVEKEIARGLAVHYLHHQDRLADFYKYGSIPVGERRRDFPRDLTDLIPHPYSSTAHSPPLRGYIENNYKLKMKSAKVPLYIQASGARQTGKQTSLAIPDAHFTRGIGMGNVRSGKNPGVSMKAPEAQTALPWFRDQVARPMGMESVPAQARLWGTLGPITGVKTDVGSPKLEMLAGHIMKVANKYGISPEKARDMIFEGKTFAKGGLVDGALERARKAGGGALGLERLMEQLRTQQIQGEQKLAQSRPGARQQASAQRGATSAPPAHHVLPATGSVPLTPSSNLSGNSANFGNTVNNLDDMFGLNDKNAPLEKPGVSASGGQGVPSPDVQRNMSRSAGSNAVVNGSLPPEAKAFLMTLSGPESGGRYNAMYPGTTFNNGFVDHPRISSAIPGTNLHSDAAGRYQFLSSTWDKIAPEIGAKNFSPANQDQGAWRLAQDVYKQHGGRDLLTDLQSGNPQTLAHIGAVLRPTWPSIQPQRFASNYATALPGVNSAPAPEVASNTNAPGTPPGNPAVAAESPVIPGPTRALFAGDSRGVGAALAYNGPSETIAQSGYAPDKVLGQLQAYKGNLANRDIYLSPGVANETLTPGAPTPAQNQFDAKGWASTGQPAVAAQLKYLNDNGADMSRVHIIAPPANYGGAVANPALQSMAQQYGSQFHVLNSDVLHPKGDVYQPVFGSAAQASSGTTPAPSRTPAPSAPAPAPGPVAQNIPLDQTPLPPARPQPEAAAPAPGPDVTNSTPAPAPLPAPVAPPRSPDVVQADAGNSPPANINPPANIPANNPPPDQTSALPPDNYTALNLARENIQDDIDPNAARGGLILDRGKNRDKAKSGGYMTGELFPAHVVKALKVLSDYARAHKAGGGALPGDVAGAAVLGQGDFPGTDFSDPAPVAAPPPTPAPAPAPTTTPLQQAPLLENYGPNGNMSPGGYGGGLTTAQVNQDNFDAQNKEDAMRYEEYNRLQGLGVSGDQGSNPWAPSVGAYLQSQGQGQNSGTAGGSGGLTPVGGAGSTTITDPQIGVRRGGLVDRALKSSRKATA